MYKTYEWGYPRKTYKENPFNTTEYWYLPTKDTRSLSKRTLIKIVPSSWLNWNPGHKTGRFLLRTNLHIDFLVSETLQWKIFNWGREPTFNITSVFIHLRIHQTSILRWTSRCIELSDLCILLFSLTLCFSFSSNQKILEWYGCSYGLTVVLGLERDKISIKIESSNYI